MTVWVFHLDTVTEYAELPLATDCYYKSNLLLSPISNKCTPTWWENDGYDWLPISINEVPPNHRLMALLFT